MGDSSCTAAEAERDAAIKRAEAAVAYQAVLQAEVHKAMAALQNGADDSLWPPSTTAVESLIKHRDELARQLDAITQQTCGDSCATEISELRKERDRAHGRIEELRSTVIQLRRTARERDAVQVHLEQDNEELRAELADVEDERIETARVLSGGVEQSDGGFRGYSLVALAEELRAEKLRLSKTLGAVTNCGSDGTNRTECGVCVACQGLRAENGRLRAALTPSAETKRCYIGEFSFVERDGNDEEIGPRVTVPWTTIKKIMAAIRAHAASRLSRKVFK